VPAAYAEAVKAVLGTTPVAGGAPAAGSARVVMRQGLRGLVQVLFGADLAPSWRSPRWRAATYAALGLALLALCAISLRAAAPGFPALTNLFRGSVVIVLAVVVPLPLAARYPLIGWRIEFLILLFASLGPGIRGWSGRWLWDQAQIAVLLVLFCAAGIRYQRSVLWWMWALTLFPWWVWLSRAGTDLTGTVLAVLAFTAAAIAVDSLGSRSRAQRALSAQAERTELEQARRAVLEERTRIARELHDVVAHHMSLMAVRAETAPYRLSDIHGPVLAEFESLSAAAREALTDMRRLLGVLRQDEPAAGRAPQPQLSDLPALVDAARRAGVSVELSVPTALDQVPGGVGLCAYRIVQESLSNASQHARGAAVTVSVDYDAHAIMLRVANGPGEPGVAAWPGAPSETNRSWTDCRPGHGLAGMRERVAMVDGSLSIGPAPGGGFVVSARLPLDAAAVQRLMPKEKA
jgi:signal transduction histidine kinase